MATYCFNLAVILARSVMHSSSRVITRDQQAKIADTQTLGKHVEWHIFIFLIFGQTLGSRGGQNNDSLQLDETVLALAKQFCWV